MNTFKQSNIVQAQAIKILTNSANDAKLEVKICEHCGCDWRRIINEFLEKYGRVPTVDELLWVCSEPHHLGDDIRIIVKKL